LANCQIKQESVSNAKQKQNFKQVKTVCLYSNCFLSSAIFVSIQKHRTKNVRANFLLGLNSVHVNLCVLLVGSTANPGAPPPTLTK